MAITQERDFELSDESSPTAEAKVLGLWRVTTPAGGFAFTASATTTPAVPLWSIDLPADPAQAARRLMSCDARLRAASQRLADAPARLEVALDRHRPEVAFTTATSATEAATDTELVGWLQRVGRACTPTAWVETRIQGEPMARSLLGPTGNLRALCRPGLGPCGAGLHQDAVRLVVSSRVALLRVVACVTRGAVAISVRLALPGGAVLALPVAWRFVQRLLGEVDRGNLRWP
jgi:hypothetical protein